MCSAAPVGESLELQLDAPLGQRSIVDASTDESKVIWSPALRAGLETADRLNPDDAATFLLSRRRGSDAKCVRRNFRYFECSYIRADTDRRATVFLKVTSGGGFLLGIR